MPAIHSQSHPFLPLDGSKAMTGDLDLDTNDLFFDSIRITQTAAYQLALYGLTDTVTKGLKLSAAYFGTLYGDVQDSYIQPRSTLAIDSLILRSRKTNAPASWVDQIVMANHATSPYCSIPHSGDITPDATGTRSIGSSAFRYTSGYLNTVYASSHVETDFVQALGDPDYCMMLNIVPGDITFCSGGNDIVIFYPTSVEMQSGYSLDCATQGAYLKPRRVSQSAEPTPDTSEVLLWRDSDDGKTYLVYNDATEGVRKVELA